MKHTRIGLAGFTDILAEPYARGPNPLSSALPEDARPPQNDLFRSAPRATQQSAPEHATLIGPISALPIIDAPWHAIARAIGLAALAYETSAASLQTGVGALGLQIYNSTRFTPTTFNLPLPFGQSINLTGASFAAYDETAKTLYISFQGTNPASFIDIGTDVLFAMASFHPLVPEELYIEQYARLFTSWVQNVLADFPGYNVVFSGHSLGGMIAETFTHWYGSGEIAPPPNVDIFGYAFGSPGVSDAWAQADPEHFFHVTRALDYIGSFNDHQHIGPSLVIADRGSEIYTPLSNHFHWLYEEQIGEIAASPAGRYISFAHRVLFLKDGEENDVTAEAGFGAIFGGELADIIRAGPGQSLIAHGEDGGDELHGGTLDDVLSGGAGWDHLFGGGGLDLLFGGAGGDHYIVRANEGQDIINDLGGTGEDVVVLHTGAALSIQFSWFSREGTDLLVRVPNGESGGVVDLRILNAGSASGSIERLELWTADGSQFVDAWNLSALWASLTVPPVTPPTIPSPGSVSAGFTHADDNVVGGGGNDWFTTDGRGIDTLDGGAGHDHLIIDYSWSSLSVAVYGVGIITARNGPLTPVVNRLTARNVESISVFGGVGGDSIGGLDGDDLLIGNDGNDELWGGRGNDALYGGAGDDLIDGAGGADWIDGGAGNDRAGINISSEARAIHCNFDQASSANGLTFINGAHVRNIEGLYLVTGAGDDQVSVTSAAIGLNSWDGGDGIDRVEIDLTAVTQDITGNSGLTYQRAPEGYATSSFGYSNVEHVLVRLGSGNDHVTGSNASEDYRGAGGADTLFGMGGNDFLSGGDGADRLFGGLGNDDLNGGAGDDYLDGGYSGFDELTGGAGNDDLWLYSREGIVVGGTGLDRLILDYADSNSDLVGTFRSGSNASAAFLSILVSSVESLVLTTGSGDDVISFIGFMGGQNRWDAGLGIDRLIVDLSTTGSAISLNVNGLGDGFFRVGSGSDQMLFFTKVDHFSVVGGAAGDVLVGGAGDDSLSGGSGDDSLNGGSGADSLAAGSGADTVRGGAGNDVISAGGGSDLLHGDDGDDTFLFAVGEPGGSTQVFGGAGTDTIILRGGAASIDLNVNGGSVGGVSISTDSIENVKFDGSADAGGGPRVAYGNEANNSLVALDILAAVTFEGRGGDDLLIGSSGADGLRGGNGNDTVSGAEGNDVIEGNAGNDNLSGDAGADTLDGGTGEDVLDGGAGQDTLAGGDGVDTVSHASSTSGVQIYLDTQVTWDGVTTDSLSSIENAIGSSHADYLGGDAGANRLDGGAGNDVLDGGAGDDVLVGGLTGLDHLRGGSGVDQITYAGHATGVQVYLDNQHSWDGVTMDFLSSIENVIGTSHADYMAGDAAANRLEGGGGDDFLEGGAGDDILIGGLSGLDHLRGGDGIDQITYAGHATGVQIYLNNQHSWDGVTMDFLSSIENVIGSSHADYMAGDAAANRLEGGGGDDFLEGGAGDDVLIGGLTGLDHLRGGAGIDQITYAGHATGVQIYLDNQNSWDGVTMDFLSSIENVIGSSHADYMAGDAAANRLEGGGGDDFLDGGAGDDFLDGGASGLDTLRGGAGTDTVSYASSGTGVEIYLDNNISWDGVTVDNLSSIENVVGSAQADYIQGSEAQNVIQGGAGNDQLAGMGGNDSIDGGSGLDTVVLRGLAADYTITAEAGGYRVVDAVAGRDGSDLLTGIETLRFSDGTSVSLPASAPASPEVLPALAGDKTAADPEVLPGAHDDIAKSDRSAPEVLPAADESFIGTGKFDLPPVMPPMDEIDPGSASGTELEQARELMMALLRENPLNASQDSLTLLDDWSGVAPPSRGDVWD